MLLSPVFSELFSDNGPIDMMDEDNISNLSVRLKLSLTVWDFVLPATPSLPAVIGVSSFFVSSVILIVEIQTLSGKMYYRSSEALHE